MRRVCREKPAWRAAGPRFILLGLITLLLLPAPARGQSEWPPGVTQTSHPGEPEVSRVNLSPPDLRSAAPGRQNPGEDPGKPSARKGLPEDLGKMAGYVGKSGRHRAHPPVARGPASGFHQDLAAEPAGSGWLPSQCPLPPASVFSLQTQFRKYLETWPTPGSTTTEDWPEYIPEDGEDVD
jgi:hypothetical protein